MEKYIKYGNFESELVNVDLLGIGEIEMRRLDKSPVFYTHIPISSLNHRKNNPTKAELKIEQSENKYTLFFKDDYGNSEIVELVGDWSVEIETIKKIARENELFKEKGDNDA